MAQEKVRHPQLNGFVMTPTGKHDITLSERDLIRKLANHQSQIAKEPADVLYEKYMDRYVKLLEQGEGPVTEQDEKKYFSSLKSVF